MVPFRKSLRQHDQLRRYTIESTSSGWVVREEQNSCVVQQTELHDWHRVERAQRAMAIKVEVLCTEGWQEV